MHKEQNIDHFNTCKGSTKLRLQKLVHTSDVADKVMEYIHWADLVENELPFL